MFRNETGVTFTAAVRVVIEVDVTPTAADRVIIEIDVTSTAAVHVIIEAGVTSTAAVRVIIETGVMSTAAVRVVIALWMGAYPTRDGCLGACLALRPQAPKSRSAEHTPELVVYGTVLPSSNIVPTSQTLTAEVVPGNV